MTRNFDNNKKAYQIVTENNVTYIRYDSVDIGQIKRIEKTSSGYNIMWAFGAWSRKANLQYVSINEMFVD